MIPEKKYIVHVTAYGWGVVMAKDEFEAIELALDTVELEKQVEDVVESE